MDSQLGPARRRPSKRVSNNSNKPLRTILEKCASFHGFKNFSACISKQSDDPEGKLLARQVNVLNHGNHSLFEPQALSEENKDLFRAILIRFLNRHYFNPKIISKVNREV